MLYRYLDDFLDLEIARIGTTTDKDGFGEEAEEHNQGEKVRLLGTNCIVETSDEHSKHIKKLRRYVRKDSCGFMVMCMSALLCICQRHSGFDVPDVFLTLSALSKAPHSIESCSVFRRLVVKIPFTTHVCESGRALLLSTSRMEPWERVSEDKPKGVIILTTWTQKRLSFRSRLIRDCGVNMVFQVTKHIG